MDLNEIAIFVKVVETGSFTGAAQALQMPRSTVSARVAALEQRLAVTLLRRTTRSLHVTQAGQAYFPVCARALAELRNAEQEVTATQETPTGVLRVSAPTGFAESVIPAAAVRFAETYPQVEVEWIFTDKRIDLLAQGIDVAVRAGVLEDSSLMARKVGVSRFALFASPRYLEHQPAIERPLDLLKHECMRFTSGTQRIWQLSDGGESIKLEVRGPVLANGLLLVKAMAVSGRGVALMPTFFCQPEVVQGQLVRLLPAWGSPTNPVHLVYPQQDFMPARTRVFLETVGHVLSQVLVP